jgi:hypothetical protein
MKVSPRLLRKLAFWAVALPAGVALLTQLAIWSIPGCNPNPYALGECMVGRANVAVPLLLVGLGGVYISLALLTVVALPLLVLSWVLDARSRRVARHAG